MKTYLIPCWVRSDSIVVLQCFTKKIVLVPTLCHPNPQLVTFHYRVKVQGEISAYTELPFLEKKHKQGHWFHHPAGCVRVGGASSRAALCPEVLASFGCGRDQAREVQVLESEFLSFYCLGHSFIHSFLVYPLWYHIGADRRRAAGAGGWEGQRTLLARAWGP